MNRKQEVMKKWAQIVARCWIDPKFKHELQANPQKVLKDYGIEFKRTKVKIVEDTSDLIHFTIPVKSNEHTHLSLDEDLKKISAAGVCGNCCTDS